MSEPRIGVYLCARGEWSGGPLDLDAIAGYARRLPGVRIARVVAAEEPLDPDALTIEVVREGLDALVVGGDSPGFFKPAFARALAQAGGDPRAVRLASFREHGTSEDGATARALDRARAEPGAGRTLAPTSRDDCWSNSLRLISIMPRCPRLLSRGSRAPGHGALLHRGRRGPSRPATE